MAREYTTEQVALMHRFNDATDPRRLEPLPHGLSLGVQADVYYQRELGVASKTACDQLERSPAHYRAWVDGIEGKPTAALKFGSALHMAVLEPERFRRTYAVEPDFGDCRKPDNKRARDEWRAGHVGAIPISADDEERIVGMMASVMRHPAASRLILDGQSEVTLSWLDPISGLRCKSRADYWVKARRMAVDIKSTEDASVDGFARSVTRYRYYVQDAFYRMGFAACGEPIEFFAILAVEKEPPYAVAVYTLDEDAVAKGYAAARRDIERLRECLERDHWPSYSDGVETLSLPPWAA